MNRSDWLKQKRRMAETRMDTLFASIYDENWGAVEPAHQRFIDKFLSLCPPQATLLDAPCGTGKYWPMILASGRNVLGTEQSQGMLDKAREKFPQVPTRKVGLQELDYQEAFEGAICMDAMELVFPEDWPLVLSNFYRALKPASYLYLTVEVSGKQALEEAFAKGRQLGLPVVYGEMGHEDGYHYYPKLDQVKTWLQNARFRLIEEEMAFFEDEDPEVGEAGYHHFLVQKS